jgi:hypothetical protein
MTAHVAMKNKRGRKGGTLVRESARESLSHINDRDKAIGKQERLSKCGVAQGQLF